MQFRLVHLFVATAIVAVGLMAADRYLYHSVLVEFTTMEVPPESIQMLNDPDYALNFTIHYNQYPVNGTVGDSFGCLLYTSPSPRDLSTSRMPSSA